MSLTAGFLPGLNEEDIDWQTLSFGRDKENVDVLVPILSDDQMKQLAAQVRNASQEHLKTLPVSNIISIIDTAIARFLDRQDPIRQTAEKYLPVITGYDAEMIRLGLTGYLKTFRQAELHRFLAEDFVNPKILDEFQPLPKGGYGRAYGPNVLAHIWAGNVPGLPLWSLISGLLVKAGNVGKVSSAEPLMASLFAKAISEIDPNLGECLAVVWWKGGDTAREQRILEEADTVVAYGNNDTLKQIRDRTPLTTRCLTFSHKVSFGMISKAALEPSKAWDVAHQAAYDIVRYDQQGCYSPHLFFVERGGAVSPQEFSQYVASELENFENKFPRRTLTIEEASGVAAWRQSEEMKSFAEDNNCVIGDEGGAWSVSYSEGEEKLAPSGLNRTAKVIAVSSLDDVPARIAPFRSFLQTVGIAAAPNELRRLADLLSAVGVTRISALEHMTSPEAGWHHDGRFNLLDLITMTEVERSAEIASETFANYVD
ncbi:MAG: acyl-CoA reductase [Rhodospirillaceae bacterium]|nr:acyl-CoA reductase [Rhodospirillaceae bacterium]|tara:strand:- start:566 stop:2017 length:1452 start_codon:yes stop_codon:yes gene_type:complete